MILKLPFKKSLFYPEREIEIMLRIGTLEDVCEDLGISFWQIKEFMQKNANDFSSLLLYHGYLTACQRKGVKVKYGKSHAFTWYEYMSVTEREKFIAEMTVLFGKIVESYRPKDKKKVKTKQNGAISDSSPSGSLDGALKDGEAQH